MKWVKADERFPIDGKPESLEDVTLRLIEGKYPVTDIWRFHEKVIELNNHGSICGDEISYNEIEWLDES